MSLFGDQGSLVKYSTPVLVNAAAKAHTTKKHSEEGQPKHTEDILGEILPPKEHRTENGQLWIQTVLSTPATKIEVIQLQEELNKRFLTKQARTVGLCPIREELFDQCFDEIIRQITIDCRERGLLLVRVRDDYRNQVKAYKNLYESSINFGMRRVIDSDHKKQELTSEIVKLEKECQELERNVTDLEQDIIHTRQTEETKLKEDAEKHKTSANEIRQINQKLKTQIQNALQKNK